MSDTTLTSSPAGNTGAADVPAARAGLLEIGRPSVWRAIRSPIGVSW